MRTASIPHAGRGCAAVISGMSFLRSTAVLMAALACVSAPPPACAQGVKAFGIPVIANAGMAPAIDGKMMPGEWDCASSLTGQFSLGGGKMAQRQVKVFYVTDGKYLYAAMSSPAVPPGTAPQTSDAAKYEGYMDFFNNDRFEAKFMPPEGSRTGYAYVVADAEEHRLILRQVDNGETLIKLPFDFRSSYDSDGWTVEFRIPLEEIAFAKDGSILEGAKINFTRVWMFPNDYCSIQKGGPHALAPAALMKNIPAFQIEKLGDIRKGKLDILATMREDEGGVMTPKETVYEDRKVDSRAIAGSGLKGAVSVSVEDIDGQEIFSESKKLALAPGRKIPFEFKKDFQVGEGCTLSVEAKLSDGRMLYKAEIPFEKYDPKEESAWKQRLEKGTVLGSWRVNSAFFPYWEKAKVKITFFKGKIMDSTTQARLSLKSDKGFSAEKTVKAESGACDVVEFQIPGLPEGTYTLKAEALDKDGKVVATKENSYARVVFPWEHNKLGLSRTVIKPWTPMEVADGNEIKCWGRSCSLGKDGLTMSIKSQGKDILAGPLEISMVNSDGGSSSLESSGEGLKFAQKAEDLVEWESAGKLGGGLTVEVSGKAEYDGFMFWSLKLVPASPVKARSLKIAVRIPKSAAQLMHFQGGWARNNFSGAIPSGEGKVYDSLMIEGGYNRPSGFAPHVWIGNQTRGISWFADSDEGWAHDPLKPAIEIIREKDDVVLSLNVINRDFEIAKPRTVSFGLMATPVKPLIKPVKEMFTRAVNWLGTDNKTMFQECMYAPVPVNFDYESADRHIKALGAKSEGCRLYFNKHELGYAMKEVKVFDNEWGGMEPGPEYPGSRERFQGDAALAINRYLTDSRIDMEVFYIAELAKKTCMAGTYWDITGIGTGMPMLENGTAYVNDEGRVTATFDIIRSRQLFKRVATMWQEIRGEPDYMEIHSTNHIGIPFYSFAYSFLNFEWLWPNSKFVREDGQWKDFIDLRPLDLFATEGTPSQFGIWISSINGGERPLEDPAQYWRIERSGAALAGLHNNFGYDPEIGRRDQIDFIGYWDEDGRIRTDSELVKASMWKNGGKLEVFAVNLSLKPARTAVSIDVSKLGLKELGNISDSSKFQELKDIVDRLKRMSKKEAAAAGQQILDERKTISVLASHKMSDGRLELCLELDSHDYGVIQASFSGGKDTPK